MKGGGRSKDDDGDALIRVTRTLFLWFSYKQGRKGMVEVEIEVEVVRLSGRTENNLKGNKNRTHRWLFN